MTFTSIDWSERATCMFSRHGITTAHADEALDDPVRVVIEPDYASESGSSVRIIGYCHSRVEVLTVIVVKNGGIAYGANAWASNAKDRAIYHGKGE